MHTAIRLVAVLAPSLLAASAGAGTIRVPSSGITTIQAAVEAAGPGDTIKIAPGRYVETVRVSSKPGLHITGRGRVIVDARPHGAIGSGPAFLIHSSPDVTIENVTCRFAKANDVGHGAGVQSNSDRLKIIGVRVESCDNVGIEVSGDDCEVRDGVLDGNGGGIKITGARARIRGVRATRNDGSTIEITGDGARVEGCDVDGVLGPNGIEVDGSGAIVIGNRVTNGADCFAMIDVKGDSNRVRRNHVAATGRGIAIAVESGGDVDVTDNDVSDAGRFGIAFSNQTTSCTAHGNRVRRCGDRTNPGFLVEGSGHLVSNNLVTACFDGFLVRGSQLTLADNRVRRNAVDGIEIDQSSFATLSGNVVEQNRAEGIDNAGFETTLSGNRARRNRTDFADAGNHTHLDANDFGTTGAPEID